MGADDAEFREPRVPHVKTEAVIRGVNLTTDLKRARRFFEEMLCLDCVQHRARAMLVRESGHEKGGARRGRPYWALEVREVDSIATPQQVLHHWGLDVSSDEEVDQAYESIKQNSAAYGLTRIQKPRNLHNAYSFYFSDVDRNWWEIEHRTPDYVYTAIRARGDWVEGT